MIFAGQHRVRPSRLKTAPPSAARSEEGIAGLRQASTTNLLQGGSGLSKTPGQGRDLNELTTQARRGIRGIVAGKSPRCLDPIRSSTMGEALEVAILAFDAPGRIIGRSKMVAVT